MPRDSRAYLSDVIEACEAITSAVEGRTLEEYSTTRLVRSAVEREFTIIGEALLALSHSSDEIFSAISHARRIIDFRNQLTHQYPTVDDSIVWAIVERDVEVLRQECDDHLRRLA
ncbi:MAG: DUF86 domain-containing protein [Gemmatimonadetes bacterium]|jgi:uncharacterized protein with HEPN domain|nr:DUF86 domain-containing protein [Gemmatimonadota bacterium]MBT4611132.1 DUF86 domain-containing protein [Gemmatimonadota bacterium]MBT5144802.1 DUF86 domain-containing protein [Gemmatimonadota bacterium]MBT5587279.1 DUF86 domain-containing protein [Gemmatimonadota bacterium]MBT5964869.1 DUF86 domain-containing protein [Gemmatimonadota bacterium]